MFAILSFPATRAGHPNRCPRNPENENHLERESSERL